MTKHSLVIGANGGIAQAIIKQLCEQDSDSHQVYTVSRSPVAHQYPNQHHQCIDATDDEQVKTYLKDMAAKSIRFDTVICATGVLQQDGPQQLKAEKRLEDVSSEQLAEYFRVNTILPALWLKYLVKVMAKQRAVVVFFSARVGSISENKLGGWYGYRASKAALNMIMKTASIEYKRRAPNTILSCYHPGTVDTGLSKPFQANVKPEKLFTPEFTATQLLQHISEFTTEDGPYYFDWNGQSISY